MQTSFVENSYFLNGKKRIIKLVLLLPLTLIGVAFVAELRGRNHAGAVILVLGAFAYVLCSKTINRITIAGEMIAIEYYHFLMKRKVVFPLSEISVKKVHFGSLRLKFRDYLHVYHLGKERFKIDSRHFTSDEDFNDFRLVLEGLDKVKS